MSGEPFSGEERRRAALELSAELGKPCEGNGLSVQLSIRNSGNGEAL